jgi:eukaryotic-like serine/threonine-protein kinase
MNAKPLFNLTADEPPPQSSIRKAHEIDATSERAPSPGSPSPRIDEGAGRFTGAANSVAAWVASHEAALSLSAGGLAAGTVLDGKYRVERKIGEGAMGVVLQATHLGLDEAVAIKLMRPEVQRMEGTLGRFAKEAKIAARIRSEHVAKVLDVGVLEPLGPYIVMEYLEGSSLAELLDARLEGGLGPLAADRVIEYMLQACEALATAHALGVIHRDVKPDNLFVTRHAGLETLKLLDFGISKAGLTGRVLGNDVRTGTVSCVMGTPLYMSPEQLLSSPEVDCRTDVWSMGAVMYELLCGEPPFRDGSIPEICAAILDAPPPELPPRCTTALKAVVMRCLEKDPAQRFQTVAELAGALVPLAAHDARAYASRSSSILRASASNLTPTIASSVSNPARPPWREATRTVRFQSSALVAAATVLALSGLGVATIVSRSDDRPAPPRRLSVPIPLPALSPLEQPLTRPVRVAPLPESELDGMTPLQTRSERAPSTQSARSKAPRSGGSPASRATRQSSDAVASREIVAGSAGARARRARRVEGRERLKRVDGSSSEAKLERGAR